MKDELFYSWYHKSTLFSVEKIKIIVWDILLVIGIIVEFSPLISKIVISQDTWDNEVNKQINTGSYLEARLSEKG